MFIILVVLLVLAVLGFFALAWHPPIAAITPPAHSAFDPALVRRGEQLGAMGDCSSCHSTREGAAYAGGVAVATPFGTIHGTNITPDPATGIGTWSEAAFRRALREGVSRDGHLLYPAFPYDHFTHLDDQDIGALYAFAMTRDPASARAPANRLRFPLQFRPLVAGWNMLYLQPGPLPQPASADAASQRGAYLVAAVAHCGACHSPRNGLGAERREAALGGGDAQGWRATALNANSPSPVPWTEDALSTYLRDGIAPDHAISAGPMQDVVQNLSHADAADIHAIAAYIHAGMQPVTPERQRREAAARQKAAQDSLTQRQPATPAAAREQATLALGASVYATTCASCHDAGRQLSSNTALRLPLAVALYVSDPRNLIHIIREGITPPEGHAGRWMPPFEGTLSDEELTALVVWLRNQADAPPWPDVARVVKASGNAP